MAYKNVGMLIRQSSPLPPFYEARSMLTLEEAGFAKEVATGSATAMVVASSPASDDSPSHHEKSGQRDKTYHHKRNGGGKKGGHQRGGSGRKGGCGGRQQSGSSGRHNGMSLGAQRQLPTYPWPGYPQAGSWSWPWALPPCPYPSTPWAPRGLGPYSAAWYSWVTLPTNLCCPCSFYFCSYKY